MKRRPFLALLLIMVLASWPARALGHPDAAPGDDVRLRFEQILRARDPDGWLVGEIHVFVDANTIVDEHSGRAEVGAWLMVEGPRYPDGWIYAETVQVVQPASQQRYTEFSGLLEEKNGSQWQVGGVKFEVTESTHYSGRPDLGALVWVRAEEGHTLRALLVDVIADVPGAQPVEFSGRVDSITPELWVIGGMEVAIDANTQVVGDIAVGQAVGVRALLRENGPVLARLILPQSSASTSAGTFGPPAMAAGWGALHRGGVGAADGQAGLEPEVTPWGVPEPIAHSLDHASSPALAFVPGGSEFAVWETSGGLYYASASSATGDRWGPWDSITDGKMPVLAVDRTGTLHMLFVNQFGENWEIYHSSYRQGAWSAPINVSHTTGISRRPSLAVAADGSLQATWIDETPGYAVVYHGTFGGQAWSSHPVPSGRGDAAALAAAPDGRLYIAWQDQMPDELGAQGRFAIYLTELAAGTWAEPAWSVPLNVSEHKEVDAVEPSVASTADSRAHVVWVEDGNAVRYAWGRGTSWFNPTSIVPDGSSTPVNVHGARVVVERGWLLHVTWDEGSTIRAVSGTAGSNLWTAPGTVAQLDLLVRDVVLSPVPAGGVMVGWVQSGGPGNVAVYESERASPIRPRFWLPILRRH